MKPIQGWAVFDSDGNYVPHSLSDFEYTSKNTAGVIYRDHRVERMAAWTRLQRQGFICRRVTVTVEESRIIPPAVDRVLTTEKRLRGGE